MPVNITNDEYLLLVGPVAAEVRNNDNSLAVRDDGDDRDDMSEVTAKSLSTGALKSSRIILMPFVVVLIMLQCSSDDGDLLV